MSKNDSSWHLQREILEKERNYLCEYLDFNRHYIYLQSRNILSTEDIEEIQSTQHTRRAKVSKMIDKLVLRGPGAFEVLCDSIIHEGTQNFVRDTLVEKFVYLKDNMPFAVEDETQKLDLMALTSSEEEALRSCDLPKPGDPGAPALPLPVSTLSCPHPGGTSQA